MQILGLLGMYIDAVVVEVKTVLLLFRLALAILCFKTQRVAKLMECKRKFIIPKVYTYAEIHTKNLGIHIWIRKVLWIFSLFLACVSTYAKALQMCFLMSWIPQIFLSRNCRCIQSIFLNTPNVPRSSKTVIGILGRHRKNLEKTLYI